TLNGHLLRQLGHRDGVCHADDALVLGGRGDLRLLQFLARRRDALLRNAARAATGAEPRPPALISPRARLAHHRRAPAQTAELLVAILDLEALHRAVALWAGAGKLNERA